MRRLLCLAALTMTALAVAAAPALADVTGNPPDYVLEEDGELVLDGDQVTDCRSFAAFLEQGELFGGVNPEQAQRALGQCEEAGLLDSGGAGPSASAGASAGASAELSGGRGPACSELGESGSGEEAQQEARALLDQDPSDPNDLDADGDGVPCEFTETSGGGGFEYEDGSIIFIDTASPVAEEDPVATTPEPAAEPAAAATLPETGGPASLLLPAAGLLLATGLVGLRAARRRS